MKPRIAVHKFSSCDGCQLAFLNAGEDLLTLSKLVDIVHFPEAGPCDPDATVDLALVEGSVSTPEEAERIVRIRERSRQLATIGACATAGGLQALRNFADADAWLAGVYATPETVSALATARPVRDYVKVDFELWGCPVDGRQVLQAVRDVLFGVAPAIPDEKICLECKRQGHPCVIVTRGEPCMGPVTRTGCGAICPSMGRGCYACFGPAENPNTDAFATRLEGLGLVPEEVARRFLFITSEAPAFREAGKRLRRKAGDG